MLEQIESLIFANLDFIIKLFFIIFAVIILFLVLYVLSVSYNKYQQNEMNSYAARIRKMLLEINYRDNCILSALNSVAQYIKSPYVFLEDLDGDVYEFVAPNTEVSFEDEREREYFTEELLAYAKERTPSQNVAIRSVEIERNEELREENPGFYEFLMEHHIKSVMLISTVDKNDHIILLGAINSKKKSGTKQLLTEISVCFSIAVYNRSYLLRTEEAAETDALTGVKNRVAYKKDVNRWRYKTYKKLTCIYIDVNELHVFNNRYGHVAGDAMLVFIADALCDFFGEYSVYRMGGDEFLVAISGLTDKDIQERLQGIKERLQEENYYISCGVAKGEDAANIEELFEMSEKEMHKEKSLYYMNKQKSQETDLKVEKTQHLITGIKEIDDLLSVMGQKYRGIYSVSLKTDHSKRIITSHFLNHGETEEKFSDVFKEYVGNVVKSEHHRDLLNLLNYEALREKFLSEENVKISYEKNDGETIALNIYGIVGATKKLEESIWVFETETK